VGKLAGKMETESSSRGCDGRVVIARCDVLVM